MEMQWMQALLALMKAGGGDAAAGGCPKQIGEIYISMTDASPETTWPGTKWEAVTDCFLRAADAAAPWREPISTADFWARKEKEA